MNTRKIKVIKCSLELFNEKGIQNTSIQDILDRSGISKGTFYNYFSSKNECVISILEQSRYEASLRRHAILIGKDISDIDVLVEQIVVLMTINQEQNLIPLFESIFHSSDEELKKIIVHHRLFELEWVAERFVDVFGEKLRPYEYESAVLFYGMMQHLLVTCRSAQQKSLDPKMIARSVLNHIEAIIPSLTMGKTAVLDVSTTSIIRQKLETKKINKADVVYELKELLKKSAQHPEEKKAQELTQALLDEIQLKTLRISVLEILLSHFYDAYQDTHYVFESREVAYSIWYYIKTLSEDDKKTHLS